MRHHETQHQELILGALESVLRERHHCMDQKRFLRENLLCDKILGSGTDRYLAARSRGSSSDASTFGAALLLSSAAASTAALPFKLCHLGFFVLPRDSEAALLGSRQWKHLLVNAR